MAQQADRTSLAPAGANVLDARLRSLRRQARMAMAGVGLGKLACLLAAIAALDLALDRTLRLAHWPRVALLCAGAAWVVWRLTDGVIRPLARSLPLHALVLEVERRVRDSNDLLASAWLFAASTGPGPGSGDLCRQTVARARERAGRLAPSALIRWRHARRWLAHGGVAVLAVAVGLMLWPEEAGVWWRRNVLLAGEQWPLRTRLVLVSAPDFLPRGESGEVVVRTEGRIPRAARMELRGLDTGATQAVNMQRGVEGAFSARVEGLAESQEFTVRAGDAVLEGRPILLVDRPELAAARVTVRPPPYTGQAPVELSWNAPALPVPRGSQVTAELEATKPLSSIDLRVDGREARSAPLSGSRLASFTVTVGGDLRCEVLLRDTLGLEAEEPLRLDLQAIADRAPSVRASAVGASEMLTPRARLPLHVEASDDYGLDAVWLDMTYDGPEGRSAFPRAELLARPGPAQWTGAHTVEVGDLGVRIGGRLAVSVGARDNCAVDGPQTGRASAMRFRVVSASELLSALLLRQQELRQDLEQAIARQAAVGAGLFRAGAARPTAQDAAGLRADQEAVADLLKPVAAGYRDVLDELLNNGVIARSAHEGRAGAVVAPLESLGGSAGAVRRSASAIGRSHSDERAGAEALRLARSALAEMAHVREQMLLLEGYAAVLTSVQEVARDQTELLRRTEQRWQGELHELFDE